MEDCGADGKQRAVRGTGECQEQTVDLYYKRILRYSLDSEPSMCHSAELVSCNWTVVPATCGHEACFFARWVLALIKCQALHRALTVSFDRSGASESVAPR